MKIKNNGHTSFFWMYKGTTIEIKPGEAVEMAAEHAKSIAGLFNSEIIEDKPVVEGKAEAIEKVEGNGKKRKSTKSIKK